MTTRRCQPMTNQSKYTEPDLLCKLSETDRKVWHLITEPKQALNGKRFYIDLKRIARKIGKSTTAVRHSIKHFIAGGLLRKVRDGRGRGRHSMYELLWVFHLKPNLASKKRGRTWLRKLMKMPRESETERRFRQAVQLGKERGSDCWFDVGGNVQEKVRMRKEAGVYDKTEIVAMGKKFMKEHIRRVKRKMGEEWRWWHEYVCVLEKDFAV